jgi:hypothetical protein
MALLLTVCSLALASASDPTIFWVSEPLQPGDTAIIAFASPTAARGGGTEAAAPAAGTTEPGTAAPSIYARQGGSWVALKTSGPTAYGIAALIPTTFAAGEFEVKAGEGGKPFTANAARPWFIYGDGGSSSTPGGHVRVVGDAIALHSGSGALTPSHLHIQVGGKELAIAARSDSPGINGSTPSRSHAFFDLPASIAPGVYPVAVSNYASGSKTPLCTFIDSATPCLSTINITKTTGVAAPSKPDTFTVNATQPGVGHDATAAVATAVSAANANGGGIVFFPTGQYFIKGPLIVEPGVVLKVRSQVSRNSV